MLETNIKGKGSDVSVRLGESVDVAYSLGQFVTLAQNQIHIDDLTEHWHYVNTSTVRVKWKNISGSKHELKKNVLISCDGCKITLTEILNSCWCFDICRFF